MTITERVIYSGRVQGVGFRFTVCEIARHFPVTGYVKNLYNGNVELVGQGKSDDLESFLKAVADRFRGNIRGSERHTLSDPEVFEGFEVHH